MTSIEVVNLQKAFQTKRKAAGLSGSLRALIKPEYSSVEAVHNLSFQMETGELLGFIAYDCQPNHRKRDGRFSLWIYQLRPIWIFNLGWTCPLRPRHAVGCHYFCGIPYSDAESRVLVWHDDQFQQPRAQRHSDLWYLSHHLI